MNQNLKCGNAAIMSQKISIFTKMLVLWSFLLILNSLSNSPSFIVTSRNLSSNSLHFLCGRSISIGTLYRQVDPRSGIASVWKKWHCFIHRTKKKSKPNKKHFKDFKLIYLKKKTKKKAFLHWSRTSISSYYCLERVQSEKQTRQAAWTEQNT